MLKRSIIRFAGAWRKAGLRAVLLFAPALCVAPVHSAGLGQLRVQSSLGKPLQANIPLLGSDIAHIAGSCVKAKLVSLDGALVDAPRTHLAEAAQAPAIVLSTMKIINEPAVTLTVEIVCGAGIQRDYQILLDPPVLAMADAQEPKAASVPVGKREKPDAARILAAGDSVEADRKKTTRHARTPIVPVAAVQAQSARAKSRKAPPKPARDVLRLSADPVAAAKDGLRLTISTVLSEPVAPRQAQAMEPAAEAQAGIVAMPRADARRDALLESTAMKLQAMQTKMQALEAEARRRTAPNDMEGAIEFTGSVEPEDTQQEAPSRYADYSFQSRIIAAASRNLGERSDTRVNADTRTNAVRSDLPVPPVEVISDVIQVAEFWLSLDVPERAVEVLESYGSVDRDSSPLPSLYLSDLYRALGEKEKYEALSRRFRLVFNSKIARWEDRRVKDRLHNLESLSYLMDKIASLWKTESVVPFLRNLLVHDRDGMREGFDLSTCRDIVFLLNIAVEIHGQTKEAHAVRPEELPASEWELSPV